MKNYSSFKSRLLKNKELKEMYLGLAPEFAIAEALISRRIEQGMSQSELAIKIGTKQSAVSRLESGSYNPSLKLLEKVAKALGLKLSVTFSND